MSMTKERQKFMVKRVIGVAGDEIRFVDGYVYINGEKSVEEYIEKKTWKLTASEHLQFQKEQCLY